MRTRDPFRQRLREPWILPAMLTASALDPHAHAELIEPRSALLIHPFPRKDVNASLGKHGFTPKRPRPVSLCADLRTGVFPAGTKTCWLGHRPFEVPIGRPVAKSFRQACEWPPAINLNLDVEVHWYEGSCGAHEELVEKLRLTIHA